jgi:hypothetical protein
MNDKKLCELCDFYNNGAMCMMCTSCHYNDKFTKSVIVNKQEKSDE